MLTTQFRPMICAAHLESHLKLLSSAGRLLLAVNPQDSYLEIIVVQARTPQDQSQYLLTLDNRPVSRRFHSCLAAFQYAVDEWVAVDLS